MQVWTKCPNCNYLFQQPVDAPPRETWPIGERLAKQPVALSTVFGSAAASIIAQADTLPHPWNHVITIVCLVVAVVAAIKVKT